MGKALQEQSGDLKRSLSVFAKKRGMEQEKTLRQEEKARERQNEKNAGNGRKENKYVQFHRDDPRKPSEKWIKCTKRKKRKIQAST